MLGINLSTSPYLEVLWNNSLTAVTHPVATEHIFLSDTTGKWNTNNCIVDSRQRTYIGMVLGIYTREASVVYSFLRWIHTFWFENCAVTSMLRHRKSSILTKLKSHTTLALFTLHSHVRISFYSLSVQKNKYRLHSNIMSSNKGPFESGKKQRE